MTNVTVPCLRCKGKGSYERTLSDGHWNCQVWSKDRGCPISEHFCNPCDMCNGYGVLVATELKAVTKAAAVSEGGKA